MQLLDCPQIGFQVFINEEMIADFGDCIRITKENRVVYFATIDYDEKMVTMLFKKHRQ